MKHPILSPTEEAAADGRRRTLYVLLRTDLPPEQQLVQASHSAAEAGQRYYRAEHGIATLVVLAVPDEDALAEAADELDLRRIAHHVFFEPDFETGNTALCTRPVLDSERRHFRKWPLWTLAAALNPAAGVAETEVAIPSAASS